MSLLCSQNNVVIETWPKRFIVIIQMEKMVFGEIIIITKNVRFLEIVTAHMQIGAFTTPFDARRRRFFNEKYRNIHF